MGYVDIRGLTKQFVAGQKVAAVEGLDLEVKQGEFVTLLGPSGCGKTTTLRCVAGLERPDHGSIVIDGVTVFANPGGVFVPTHRRQIGMVFQSYAIWPHMTVTENVSYPLKVQKVASHAANQRVQDALELVGLNSLGHRYPSQLSGGQQQRVALARALVAEPKVLLLDEPLSNLDAKLRERMRLEILTLRRRVRFTAIYVTHDQTEALTMSDRVVVMNHGRVQQIGSPRAIYDRPANQFVADFIGATNLISATVSERQADGLLAASASFGRILLDVTDEFRPGEPVLVSVRPEAVVLSEPTQEPCNNLWPGEITEVSFAGPTSEFWVRVGRQVLRSFTLASKAPSIGDVVSVAVSPGQVTVFPEEAPQPLFAAT